MTGTQRRPGMLMIGSAGRNAGKTEFACSVIRNLSPRADIVGVKVTTILKKDGTCPRGGKGCGVCSSLKGDYCITDEADAPADKDTARLAAAGASKVFWLRVMKTHLHRGLCELLEMIDPQTAIVCESNSLREVVTPGLFIMVKNNRTGKYKASAEAVREFADRTVVFDGTGFDMDPLIARICEALRPHFREVMVSAADAKQYSFLGVPVAADREAGRGPLMGIASALSASACDLNLVVACDMPEMDIALVRRMLRESRDCDIVVPESSEEGLQPLFAVYRKNVAATAAALLADGEGRVRALLDKCRTKRIRVAGRRFAKNLNTMEEYRAYVGPGVDTL
jgi:molybdopterin-guanine dinucleotide biosynthesis protein A